MNRPKKFPEGSTGGQETEAACVRAIDAYMKLGATADKLITAIEGAAAVPVPIGTEDSLQAALAEFMEPDQ